MPLTVGDRLFPLSGWPCAPSPSDDPLPFPLQHTASANRGGRDRQNTIIHYHGQERAPTNINDAIPREYLERFEAAGLIDEARRELLGLDIEPSE